MEFLTLYSLIPINSIQINFIKVSGVDFEYCITDPRGGRPTWNMYIIKEGTKEAQRHLHTAHRGD